MKNIVKLEFVFSEDQYWQLSTLLRRLKTNTEILKEKSLFSHRFELAKIYEAELSEITDFINILDEKFKEHLRAL